MAYQVDAIFRAIDQVSGTAQQIGRNVDGLSGTVTRAGQSMMAAGAKMTAGVTAPIVGLGVAAAKAAIDVESAFAGVIKTTDGLVDSTGTLTAAGESLKQQFRDLAKEVPLAVEELMHIGEIGGQLGIGKDQLIEFTRTIAALGVSTNLSTDEAATALARISNIFAVSTDDMGENVARLGSTIVALGNNFATTEAEITNFALRIAGAGKIAGLSQADILAIGTAMSSVGVQAEAGGTAVQKVLIAMNTAVTSTGQAFVDNTAAIGMMEQKLMSLNANLVRYEAQTGMTAGQMRDLYQAFREGGGSLEEFGRQLGDSGRQKLFETVLAIDATREAMAALAAEQGKPVNTGNLTTFAKVAGMTATEFKAAWQEDAAGAFQKFVEGLAAEGDNAVNVLSDLGLEDQRLVRSFLSLANAGDLLGETIAMAGEAWDENSALTREAGLRYATVESQLAILKNTFKDFLVTLGDRFLPIIREVVDWLKPLIDGFSKAPDSVIATGLAVAGLVAAIGPALMVMGALTTALGFLLSPIGLVVAAVAALAVAFATNFGGIRDA
ncbi:MAG: phage tail tape measure protein, partial [Polyangiaceae bacterium]|nr:phage tail tape measure protein [Polyangiaceae bacterium]